MRPLLSAAFRRRMFTDKHYFLPLRKTRLQDDLPRWVRGLSGSSSAEKFSDQPCHVLRLLEMRHMPGTIHYRNARTRDPPCEFLRISRRNNAVGFAPDDQGRRGDAVDVFFQAFVGKRPDEFAGAGLRPDEADLGIDAFRGVARHLEEFFRVLALGVGEQS